MHLLDLPVEILSKVLCHAEPENNFCRIALVCRQLRLVLHSSSVFRQIPFHIGQSHRHNFHRFVTTNTGISTGITQLWISGNHEESLEIILASQNLVSLACGRDLFGQLIKINDAHGLTHRFLRSLLILSGISEVSKMPAGCFNDLCRNIRRLRVHSLLFEECATIPGSFPNLTHISTWVEYGRDLLDACKTLPYLQRVILDTYQWNWCQPNDTTRRILDADERGRIRIVYWGKETEFSLWKHEEYWDVEMKDRAVTSRW